MRADRTNVLLVDDTPARLLSYEAILERLDQNLVRAGSGPEALARLAEMEFAAILLDVNMPGMDGFETADRIRRDPRGRHIPIIFVTGVYVTDLDRLRGYELGAADYVSVPVVPEILRSKVQVLVQLYQQRLELSRLNEQLVAANAELARAHEQLQVDNSRALQRLNGSLEQANAQLRAEVAERRRAEEMLKAAARRKDEFISILAHELRNPIAAIHSGVELMRMPALPEAKLDWARDLLARQLRHLVRLIDDLLDVSRVTTGRVRLQRETIDLNELVAQSIEATRPLIDERLHTVHFQPLPEPILVDADPVRLNQVFGNLLVNASKYMDEGGRITITLEAVAGLPNVVARVRDEGEGIPPDMLDQVFELFAQAGANPTRTTSGLGIGLALVRGLVELHGGRAYATSDGPGRGSEFVVELPRATVRRSPAPVPRPAAPPAAPLRLLIIDDNVDAARGLALYLKSSSRHELRLAHTGANGVAAAAEFMPDVVLLDIGLPDIDGYEVARRLRRNAALGAVPLIAMTGFGGAADRERAREAGFDHFLVKPVAFSALESVLGDLEVSQRRRSTPSVFVVGSSSKSPEASARR